MHDAPTAIDVTVVHVPVARYSAPLTALRVMLLAVAAPLFVMVIAWLALVLPRLTLPKESELGEAENEAAGVGHAVLPERYQM